MKKTQTWHQNLGVVGLDHFDVADLKRFMYICEHIASYFPESPMWILV